MFGIFNKKKLKNNKELELIVTTLLDENNHKDLENFLKSNAKKIGLFDKKFKRTKEEGEYIKKYAKNGDELYPYNLDSFFVWSRVVTYETIRQIMVLKRVGGTFNLDVSIKGTEGGNTNIFNQKIEDFIAENDLDEYWHFGKGYKSFVFDRVIIPLLNKNIKTEVKIDGKSSIYGELFKHLTKKKLNINSPDYKFVDYMNNRQGQEFYENKVFDIIDEALYAG